MIETNRVEYKVKLTDNLEKEVVAFLNYKEGGVIYIGIDNSGEIVGIENCDEVQLKIKDKLKYNIEPSCLGLFDVIVEEREQKSIIKIIVASGSETPYYIKKYGMSPKGCFVRLGSASEQMSTNMIEKLFSRRTRNSLGKIKSHRQDLTFEQLKIYYD
jgi:predicted HTH transcriptional regulator